MKKQNDEKKQVKKQKISFEEKTIDVLKGEKCPFCGKNTLTLMESEIEVPFFGELYLFSMDCSNCKYHKSDVEAKETHEPMKYEIEVNSEDDMKIRIIKSSTATIKIPRIITITPGPASNGYITNIEGILTRVKEKIEQARDETEDNTEKKKAKNMIKKLQKVIWGQEKLKITIEDPSGNSAIISEKARITKLNKKQLS